MAYHVEIRRSVRRAWAFNLDGERVHRGVVEPWLAGRPLRLGDRDWQPRDSALRIVEGPELEAQDLAFGQGWNAAERTGEDVTRRLLNDAARARTASESAHIEAIRTALASALAGAAAADPVLAPLRSHLLSEPESLGTLAAHLRRALAERPV